MLKVSEIFFSIQGESSYSGLPCIFIRLAGCNLRCAWCDTPYHSDNVQTMSTANIMKRLKKFSGINLVEVTGGEPLIQDEAVVLLEELLQAGYTVLLETNGSLPIAHLPLQVHKIVDVKCPSSGEADKFHLANLQYLSSESDELKFVIADRPDYDYAKNFLQEYDLWDYNVLFSCVFERLQPEILISWTLADRLPVRFQLQLHKYIWHPAKRGV